MSESKPEPPDLWPWFHGDSQRHPLGRLPAPPPWRDTSDAARRDLGVKFQVTGGPKSRTVDVVNAALLLRRPILITGKPGTGKSTLARAVAEELELGEVIVWPITTRTTLQQGLYYYDAIGRLHAVSIRRQKLELRRLLGRRMIPLTRTRSSGSPTKKTSVTISASARSARPSPSRIRERPTRNNRHFGRACF